ncbi:MULTISPECIES: VOC family protein [unclassified Streptomyces]|uniref:VOC family protein n=1 Tax=Streptomyces niveiscabiei TaxID=164115 RepID=A0ABW9HV93_9ACTN|nr:MULTISPECIES: VOC family protein [unclassified Streptomyces]QZZ31624.1 VOC family protein [Streptomyces sp. ST1015]
MPFTTCISVRDTAASIAFYESLGFQTDSTIARPGDDVHLLLHQGEFCGLLYSNADLKEWLPPLADTPIGLAGMLYLTVDDFDAFHDRVARKAEILKGPLTDDVGQRVFYFRDIDGYVIGIHDNAAFRASELAETLTAGRPSGSASPH